MMVIVLICHCITDTFLPPYCCNIYLKRGGIAFLQNVKMNLYYVV